LRDRRKVGEGCPAAAAPKDVCQMIAANRERRHEHETADAGSRARRVLAHRLFWPVLTLIVLLDGERRASTRASGIYSGATAILYGSVGRHRQSRGAAGADRDGMTLVIATRGIDISVGAVVAIRLRSRAQMIGANWWSPTACRLT